MDSNDERDGLQQIDWVEELEKKKERLEKAIENYAMERQVSYSYTDENGKTRYNVIKVPSSSFKKHFYWGASVA